jgi:hypothetical protein
MESSLCEKPERHASRRLSDHLTFEGQKQKVHSLVDKVTLSHRSLLSGPREAIHESGMRENCTFRLSGGRRRALQWAPPPTRQPSDRLLPYARGLRDFSR